MLENRDTPLRWLNDQEWESCGYDVKRIENSKMIVSREPIKRFDDEIEDNNDFVVIDEVNENDYIKKVRNIIKSIKKKYHNVEPHDIAIIFLENKDINYRLMDELEFDINKTFNFQVNKAYITKSTKKDQVFMSNRNNIKGLEFPFIICVSTAKITSSKTLRNALYMILTRSFITSYLLLSDTNERTFIDSLNEKLVEIHDSNKLIITEPNDEIKVELDKQIISSEFIIKSKKEIAEEIMKQLKISPKDQKKIHKMIEDIIPEDADKEKIETAIKDTAKVIDNLKA